MNRPDVSRLIITPRRAMSLTQAGRGAIEDAGRQLRGAGRKIDGVLTDIQAMRQIAERLDTRLASLQQQVDAFSNRVEHVEKVTETVEHDVREGVDRLPELGEGALHRLRSALSGEQAADKQD